MGDSASDSERSSSVAVSESEVSDVDLVTAVVSSGEFVWGVSSAVSEHPAKTATVKRDKYHFNFILILFFVQHDHSFQYHINVWT